MTATLTYAETVTAIRAELKRLNSLDSGNWTGIIVNQYGADSLPEGWVRVGVNGAWDRFGPAADVLEALRDTEIDPERVNYTEHDGTPVFDTGWLAAHEAVVDFAEKVPDNSRDWPADLISFEQLEEGTVNDNPNTLVAVRTNAGTRYAAGPHGVSCCALGDWLDNAGDLAETREEAIDACEFAEEN